MAHPSWNDAFPSLTDAELEGVFERHAKDMDAIHREACEAGKAVADNKVLQFTRRRNTTIMQKIWGVAFHFQVMLLHAREARIDLEKRVAALEARPELKDAGVWREGTAYAPGNIVSHAGSAWICNKATEGKPPGDGWRLLVKRGRDAAKPRRGEP